MANKYLQLGSVGFPEEVEARDTSVGAGDAGKLAALDGTGKLSSTMMPAGIGTDSKSMTAAEALAAGDLVYITAAGTVMKADANDIAKAAVGFVLTAIGNGASGIVYFEGTITGLSGLTPGAQYFLSATAGQVVLAASLPTAAGDVAQPIGRAISATEINFEAGHPIKRA